MFKDRLNNVKKTDDLVLWVVPYFHKTSLVQKIPNKAV